MMYLVSLEIWYSIVDDDMFTVCNCCSAKFSPYSEKGSLIFLIMFSLIVHPSKQSLAGCYWYIISQLTRRCAYLNVSQTTVIIIHIDNCYMSFTVEDRHLVKLLVQNKCNGRKHLLKKFHNQGLTVGGLKKNLPVKLTPWFPLLASLVAIIHEQHMLLSKVWQDKQLTNFSNLLGLCTVLVALCIL